MNEMTSLHECLNVLSCRFSLAVGSNVACSCRCLLFPVCSKFVYLPSFLLIAILFCCCPINLGCVIGFHHQLFNFPKSKCCSVRPFISFPFPRFASLSLVVDRKSPRWLRLQDLCSTAPLLLAINFSVYVSLYPI